LGPKLAFRARGFRDGAPRHGVGAGGIGARVRWSAGDDPGILDRSLRGDEPGVQEVRGRGWLCVPPLLAGATRQQGSAADLEGGDVRVHGCHRAARAGDVGGWRVRRRPGRLSGHRRELVRGRRISGIRRQVAAHGASLATGVRRRPVVRGHHPDEQLRAPGAGQSGIAPGPWHLRDPRYGRKREGVVLERHQRPQAGHGWRLE
jgi:hypothetical protein